MKNILLTLVAAILFSCGNQKEAVSKTSQEIEKKVELNKTVPYKETVILIGQANEDGLRQEPFNVWYEKNYADYEVDTTSNEALKYLLKDIKIQVFMGTWCSDSQRETPRFYKIIKEAGIGVKDIELITMSREKDTPEGYEVGLNITNVPTFIFYKNDKEINRIVESPITSLEKDMITILTGQEYKHTYAD